MTLSGTSIGDGEVGRWSLLPRVVTSRRHTQPSTHEGDRERGLLRVDELEYLHCAHRLRSPSLAKKSLFALTGREATCASQPMHAGLCPG